MTSSGVDIAPTRFLGARVDFVSRSDALASASRAMQKRFRLQFGDVNVSKLIDMQGDAELRRYVDESDIVCADGMGIVWGCRLLGVPVAERVTGIDLMTDVIELCEREKFRPYFFGSTEKVVNDLVARLKVQHPGLEIAGWRNGYFSVKDEPGIVADIRGSGADCLFVGMSSPLKERFLNRYRDELGVPVQIGVGGAFDVVSGNLRRAPKAMQKLGLEWVFRLVQEPRRLAGRYYSCNSKFIVMLAQSMLPRVRRRLGI